MSDGRVIPIHRQDERLTAEIEAAIRIVEGIRAGDGKSEAEMVQRYSRGLHYLLVRKTGDEERARDLVQETLLIAIRKLREQPLENPQRLAGYLRGIAIRVALNAGRRKSKEPYLMDTEAINAIPDPEQSQFAVVSEQELKDAVRTLLDKLKKKRDRELLLRYYVLEEDKPEICRALGLDSLHFNRVLYRAKARFRKILEETGTAQDLSPE